MTNVENLWQEQRDAARSIRERFGVERALGYLLGEKLLNHLHAADRDPRFASTLPHFVAEVRDIFSREELRQYFSGPRRIGAAAHVLDAEEYGAFRAAGALGGDVAYAAQDAMRFERMRSLVLGE